MDYLPFVSTIGPHSRAPFSITLQTLFDDLDGLEVHLPTLGPVQLISDGYRFYEAPLLSTLSRTFDPSLHSAVDVKMNTAPSLAIGANIVLALLHVPAPPTPGPLVGTEPSIHVVAHPPPPLPLPPPPSPSPSPSPSTGTGTANTGVAAPQSVFSESAAHAQIEAYIRTAKWFQLNALEARVGDSNVPVSALQLAKRGQSIWACFVRRIRRKGRLTFKCTTCTHESDRLHRAVSHQRAKWGHKPFSCMDPGW